MSNTPNLPVARSLAIRWASTWPRAGDPAAAVRLADRFAALGRGATNAASQTPLAEVLASLGGNSPFLADLALREAETLRAVLRRGPDAVVADRLQALARVPCAAPHARIAAALRQAKRQIALAVAVADIGDAWRLEQVCGALSALAEAALQLATDHLLLAAHHAGALTLADTTSPSRGCGFAVLAMGKLGARELNYSSDIDLVLLYDPEMHPAAAANGALSGTFTRLSRALAGLMEVRDADGYVFRTDFRLRPDPAATPPAVSMPAALTYYESMGQTWERLAMIKARPVAGDIVVGTRFLDAIRSFIWRRHLDFAAIADIQGMKRRIDCHKGSALLASSVLVERIAGHNLKLGEGGIREVEFLAQTLQMVWGGRDPGLRDPTTLGALRRLATAGKMAPRAIAELGAAYRFLRRTEHRLQMVADRQTHTLPKRAVELEQFAHFMAFDSAEAFAAVLLRHLGRVRRHFSGLFENETSTQADELDFRGDGEAATATLAAVAALGFDNPQGIATRIRGWLEGQVRALRSQRSRDLMEALLPQLLASLARQTQPDTAFARFDGLLSRLPASVQLLSLLQRNHALLDRIAAVLGAAPALADHLASTPSALEGLLSPVEVDAAPARTLASQLQDARELEGTIAITRRFIRGEEFRLSVRRLEGVLDVDSDGAARTALADAAVGAILPRVMAEFATRHGRIRGGGLVIVALGKAGGHEMISGSDLDLMLLYDHPDDVLESEGLPGVRKFAPSQYFIRASHAVVAAITAPGVEGPLYSIDMRLRPSGRKGPVAISLAGFQRYHAESAWTWERMALTRARVIAGPARLRAAVSDALRKALNAAAPPNKLRADAAAMRARLARDLPAYGPWDVKHRCGGLMEVEFIAQVLQLLHGDSQPSVFNTNTCTAFARLRDAGLLPAGDAAALIRADRLWRGVQGTLRIAIGPRPVVDLPETAAHALLNTLRPIIPDAEIFDVKALHATLDATAAQVRALFISHVGMPDDQALKGDVRQ